MVCGVATKHNPFVSYSVHRRCISKVHLSGLVNQTPSCRDIRGSEGTWGEKILENWELETSDTDDRKEYERGMTQPHKTWNLPNESRPWRMNESRPLTGYSKVCNRLSVLLILSPCLWYQLDPLLLSILSCLRSIAVPTTDESLSWFQSPDWISPVWSLHPVDQCRSMGSRPNHHLAQK